MTRQGQDEEASRTGVNRLEMSTVKRGRTNMIPVVSWQVVPLVFKATLLTLYIVNGKLWTADEWFTILFHVPRDAAFGR